MQAVQGTLGTEAAQELGYGIREVFLNSNGNYQATAEEAEGAVLAVSGNPATAQVARQAVLGLATGGVG